MSAPTAEERKLADDSQEVLLVLRSFFHSRHPQFELGAWTREDLMARETDRELIAFTLNQAIAASEREKQELRRVLGAIHERTFFNSMSDGETRSLQSVLLDIVLKIRAEAEALLGRKP